MSWPVVFGVCENDLQRDQEFLRAFAQVRRVDLSLTPLGAPVLTDRAARLLGRRLEAAAAAGIKVAALLIHSDADTRSAAKHRAEILAWAQRQRLRVPVIPCAPEPCLERWLCRCAELKGASAPAAAPCEGWKKSWSRPRGVDLDRVREAAGLAATRLRGLPDFDAFERDWRARLPVHR